MSKSHASSIFPPITPLPQVLGAPRLRSDVLAQIHSDAGTLSGFLALAPPEQEAFLEFCMGNRGLKATYDPFFQNLFDPISHPGRLDRLLSRIMKQPVLVRKVLPRERKRISEDSSLLIMDILVELADGSLVSVEMQRIGYDFPVERCFCYAADLLVRQYDLIRKEKGKKFSYRDMRPVCVIVLMEKSPEKFWQHPDRYIHRSHFSFGSGLSLPSLMNFIYIPLDIFRAMPHNRLKELDAWLYFLGSDDPKDMQRIVQKYPFFQELYQDIIRFRYRPKEVISMYSEALAIMDKNTVEYMIDEMRAKMRAEMQTEIRAEMQAEIRKKDRSLQQKDAELRQKDTALQQKDTALRQKDTALQQRDIALQQKDNILQQKDNALQQKDALIRELQTRLMQSEQK